MHCSVAALPREAQTARRTFVLSVTFAGPFCLVGGHLELVDIAHQIKENLATGTRGIRFANGRKVITSFTFCLVLADVST